MIVIIFSISLVYSNILIFKVKFSYINNYFDFFLFYLKNKIYLSNKFYSLYKFLI